LIWASGQVTKMLLTHTTNCRSSVQVQARSDAPVANAAKAVAKVAPVGTTKAAPVAKAAPVVGTGFQAPGVVGWRHKSLDLAFTHCASDQVASWAL
jgi:hypothetical protein